MSSHFTQEPTGWEDMEQEDMEQEPTGWKPMGRKPTKRKATPDNTSDLVIKPYDDDEYNDNREIDKAIEEENKKNRDEIDNILKIAKPPTYPPPSDLRSRCKRSRRTRSKRKQPVPHVVLVFVV